MPINDKKELYVKVAVPKGQTASAIQLKEDIWKIENELDLLYSSAKSGYESYAEPGETGTLLKVDGTLILSYPSEKECNEKFAEMKVKLSKSATLPKMVYQKLELQKYKISKKIQGSLEDVAPKDLVKFLRGDKQEVHYEPKKVSLEFVEPKSQKNFIKITFDEKMDKEKLVLDVTVESNKVKYAQETIRKIEELIGK